MRVNNAAIELEVLAKEKYLFDKVIVNDEFGETVNSFFRLMRDWYPALPSAARLRMLQRRVKNVKLLVLENKDKEKQKAIAIDDDGISSI